MTRARLLTIATLLTLSGALLAQARCSPTVVAGGTIQIQLDSNDATVEMSAAGSSHVTSHPASADRRVTIPVPPVPPGTILLITVGPGLRAQVLTVEVIEL